MEGHDSVALIILDGWGEAPGWGGNAISLAHLPYFPQLRARAANAHLLASGQDVGLPGLLPGNSEAGHLNIGAGRIVDQDFTYISKKISEGGLVDNAVLNAAAQQLKQSPDARLHFIGLASEGGVHSHIDHLLSLLDFAERHRIEHVLLHLIGDGRDVSTQSLDSVLRRLERNQRSYTQPKIASVIGRFYAMDRDGHVGRTTQAIELYLNGKGEAITSKLTDWLKSQYSAGLTDEYLPAACLLEAEEVAIRDNDVVIIWNFRPDRTRQLIEGLTTGALLKQTITTPKKNVFLATFVPFQEAKLTQPIFQPPVITDSLPKVLASAGKTQLHIAETEKYAHVTYFFNGGSEEKLPGEERVLVESGDIRSFSEQPEMKAKEIVAEATNQLRQKKYDFIVINFANADMVGHTGDMRAAIQALQAVDAAVAELVGLLESNGYTIIITADHGNAEEMIIPSSGEPEPAHTKNPVPFLLLNTHVPGLRPWGRLSDIAPTILELMGIPQPQAMTGISLLHP